jgi:outer membrane protein assembly factor BamB
MFALLLTALLADARPLVPPLKREMTVQVSESAYMPKSVLLGNRLYVEAGRACASYEMPSLKKLWSTPLPTEEYVQDLAVSGERVYVSTSTLGSASSPSSLVVLDRASGKILWTLPRKSRVNSAVAVEGNTIFTALAPGQVSAVHAGNKKVLWTIQLPKSKPNEDEVRSIISGKGWLVVSAGNQAHGIDLVTRKLIWTESPSYLSFGSRLVQAAGVVWVPLEGGSVGRDVQTGKVLWRQPDFNYSEYGGVFSGMFVGLDKGELVALNPKTGEVLWRHVVGPKGTSGGAQYGGIAGGLLYARGIDSAVIVNAKGEALWKGKDEASPPKAVWGDGKVLVCFDGERLLRYVAGAGGEIPKDQEARRKLAREMVARFKELDQSEQAQLVELGDDAFEPLLAAFVETWTAYDKVGGKGDTYPLYSRAQDLGALLGKVTKAGRADDLLRTLEAVPAESSAKPLLLSLLARYGDPATVTPYMLKELEGVKTPGFELYQSSTFVARSYIAASSDPRAVAFMIKQLQDPTADSVVRFEAYVNLARTGGEEGLKAVLAERNHRQLLRPLAERALSRLNQAVESGSETALLKEHRTPDGRTWGLFESGVLGRHGDLWIAEKISGAWADPVFTGVGKFVGRFQKPDAQEEEYRGKKVSEIIGGAWVDLFLNDESLRKDSDGDGLTDIAERRLGTDPARADTDGDGDNDQVDPWPNAPNRELNEEEKLYAAVFEARHHFNNNEGPALFTAPVGLQPFEMPGRRGPTLWRSDDKQDHLKELHDSYEQGVAFIRFDGGDKGNAIRWNKEKTAAGLVISIYFGGLNGTGYDGVVQKFGDDWVVVWMRRAYVS